MMCADTTCGGDQEHCCSSRNCEGLGGPRPCQVCPWSTPHSGANDTVLCEDGQYVTNFKCVEGGHGARMQCPPDSPMMCADTTCGGGREHCCSSQNCNGLGVPKACNSCPWSTPHSGAAGTVLCADGQLVSDFRCVVGGHGERVRCPSDSPMMCADKTCGDGQEHCCSSENCAGLGGPRACQGVECDESF